VPATPSSPRGDDEPDPGPSSVAGTDSEPSAQEPSPLAHAREAEGLRWDVGLQVEAWTVIAHLEADLVPPQRDRDRRRGTGGVAAHVHERFLDDAVDEHGTLGAHGNLACVGHERAADAGAPVELATEPLDRRDETLLVEGVGP